jgi:hypothetical protein
MNVFEDIGVFRVPFTNDGLFIISASCEDHAVLVESKGFYLDGDGHFGLEGVIADVKDPDLLLSLLFLCLLFLDVTRFIFPMEGN